MECSGGGEVSDDIPSNEFPYYALERGIYDPLSLYSPYYSPHPPSHPPSPPSQSPPLLSREFPYYALAMCIYDPLSLTEGLRFQLLTHSPLAHDHTGPIVATRPASSSFHPSASTTVQSGGKLSSSGVISSSSSSSTSSSSQSTSDSLNEPRNASVPGLGQGQGSIYRRKGAGGVNDEVGEDGSYINPQLQVTTSFSFVVFSLLIVFSSCSSTIILT